MTTVTTNERRETATNDYHADDGRCADCRYTCAERAHTVHCPDCRAPVCTGSGDSGIPDDTRGAPYYLVQCQACYTVAYGDDPQDEPDTEDE